MQELLDDDLIAQAEAHFRELRTTQALVKIQTNQWKLFDYLYQSLRDPTKRFPAKEIAYKLGMETKGKKPEDSARQCAESLRNSLRRLYENPSSYPVRFALLNDGDGYYLTITRTSTAAEKTVPIIFEHRGKNANVLNDFFCGSEDPLLFVSISPDKILDRIKPWFESDQIRTRHLRALIWQPESPAASAAFAKHLGQVSKDFQENIDKAWGKWKELEDRYPFLEVYGYRSSPTMMLIANSSLMQVELLPFNDPKGRERGIHAQRPALLLRPEPTEQPQSFQLFKDAFDDLWFDAMRHSEKTVHPRWREQRLARLAEREKLRLP
jgi:hypothetical protein